jgi:hypothetical protein
MRERYVEIVLFGIGHDRTLLAASTPEYSERRAVAPVARTSILALNRRR